MVNNIGFFVTSFCANIYLYHIRILFSANFCNLFAPVFGKTPQSQIQCNNAIIFPGRRLTGASLFKSGDAQGIWTAWHAGLP